jgi:hypothetical protein
MSVFLYMQGFVLEVWLDTYMAQVNLAEKLLLKCW